MTDTSTDQKPKIRLTALSHGAGCACKLGPAELAQVLRQRVTSKGGTTEAAIRSMEGDGVQALFVKALQAACRRARELGDEFGR